MEGVTVLRVDQEAGLALVQVASKISGPSHKAETVWVSLDEIPDKAGHMNPHPEGHMATPPSHLEWCAGHQMSQSPYEIVADAEKGSKCLQARHSMQAGSVVVLEPPLLQASSGSVDQVDSQALRVLCQQVLLMVPGGQEQAGSGLQSVLTVDNLIPAIVYARCPDQSVRQSVLALSAPSVEQVGPLYPALKLAVGAMQSAGLLPREGVAPGDDTLTADAFVRVILIFMVNAFQSAAPGSGEESGGEVMGLYAVACRMNHSCLPNCWWYCRDDGILQMVALVDIAKGEELTHSYLGRDVWRPTAVRRELLRSAKFFECRCARCSQQYDTSRGFTCPSCKRCNIFPVPELLWGDAGVPPHAAEDISPCTRCGARPGPEWAKKALWLEARAERTAREAQEQFETAVPVQALLEVHEMAHGVLGQHWVMASIHDLLHDLYKMDLRFDEAAYHMHQRLAIMLAVYARPSTETCWLLEDLGDDLAGLAGLPPLVFMAKDYVLRVNAKIRDVMPAHMAHVPTYTALLSSGSNELHSRQVLGPPADQPCLVCTELHGTGSARKQQLDGAATIAERCLATYRRALDGLRRLFGLQRDSSGDLQPVVELQNKLVRVEKRFLKHRSRGTPTMLPTRPPAL